MDFINNSANIFFFVTTILVVVMILVALVLLFASIKVYHFMQRFVVKAEKLIEDNKTNDFVKKAVPIVLPILGFFFKAKKHKK